MQTYYDDNYSKVSHKDWWSPIEVKTWLFKELFPICLKEYYLKNKIRKQKDFKYEEECKRYYFVEECKEIKVNNTMDIIELNDNVRILQTFYTTYRERRLKFNCGSSKMYNSLLLLLEGCTIELYLPYIAGNLGIECNSLKELKDYIISRKIDNQKIISYSQIELLLRCFIECIEKGKANLSQQGYSEF